MLKLMQLELRKHRFDGYLRAVLIADAIILLFVLGINFAEKAEGLAAFRDYAEALYVVDLFVRLTFVVFASVLIASSSLRNTKTKRSPSCLPTRSTEKN